MKRDTRTAQICSRSIHPPSAETLHTQPATTKSMFHLILSLKLWFMQSIERREELRCQLAFKCRQKSQKLQSDMQRIQHLHIHKSQSNMWKLSESDGSEQTQQNGVRRNQHNYSVTFPCNFKATSICQTTINCNSLGSVTSACVGETRSPWEMHLLHLCMGTQHQQTQERQRRCHSQGQRRGCEWYQ